MKPEPFSPDDAPKRDVFRAPEGYFEQLPSRIQARALASSQRPSAIRWTWRRTWFGLAGASLVAALVYLSIPVRQEGLGEETFGRVATEDIVGYLNDRNLTPLDLHYLIGTSADEAGTARLSGDDSLSTVEQLDVSEEDIRQHLDPEDIRDLI